MFDLNVAEKNKNRWKFNLSTSIFLPADGISDGIFENGEQDERIEKRGEESVGKGREVPRPSLHTSECV